MLGELMPQLLPIPRLRASLPGERAPEGRPKGGIKQRFFQGDHKRGRVISACPQGKVAIGTAVHCDAAVRPLHMVPSRDGCGECVLDGHRLARFLLLSAPPRVRKAGLIVRPATERQSDEAVPGTHGMETGTMSL